MSWCDFFQQNRSIGILLYFVDIQMILQKMIFEFKIQPSIYLLNEYILPYMKDNIEKAQYLFVLSQVRMAVYSNAIVIYLLTENRIRDAAKFSK